MPARIKRQTHGVRHSHRVLRVRDSSVQQNAVRAEFHSVHDVAGRTNASVNDHRILRTSALFGKLETINHHAYRRWICNTTAAANRTAGGHDAGSARITKPRRNDRIITRIAEHCETVLHQLLACFERSYGVRQQRGSVAKHFQLDPTSTRISKLFEYFATKPGNAHRIIRCEAAGGVWQNRQALQRQKIQDRSPLGINKALAAHGHRDAIGSGRLNRGLHRCIVPVLAGADHQSTVQSETSDAERRQGRAHWRGSSIDGWLMGTHEIFSVSRLQQG